VLDRAIACRVQVALDVQHHHTMAALQQRVNSRERIVGWFSTGDPDASRSRDALIHSFYGNECPNPVHLALDTSGQGGRMGVRAFVSRALSIGGRELAREFLEVDCEVRGTEAERVGLDLLRWAASLCFFLWGGGAPLLWLWRLE
jgi:translation initiation factor 3 subunit F